MFLSKALSRNYIIPSPDPLGTNKHVGACWRKLRGADLRQHWHIFAVPKGLLRSPNGAFTLAALAGLMPGPSFARGGLFPAEKTANPCLPTCPTCPIGFRARQSLGPKEFRAQDARKFQVLQTSTSFSPFQHVPHVSSFMFRGPYKGLPICLRPKSLHSRLSSLYLLTLYCQYVCAYPG